MTIVLMSVSGVGMAKLSHDQDGTNSRQIRACKFVFHTSCVYGKDNFLYTRWTDLADSVNLRKACDAGHALWLSAVQKMFFDTAAQRKVKFMNNVILFGGVYSVRLWIHEGTPPPPSTNKDHINTEVQESLIVIMYYGFTQGLSLLVLYFRKKFY